MTSGGGVGDGVEGGRGGCVGWGGEVVGEGGLGREAVGSACAEGGRVECEVSYAFNHVSICEFLFRARQMPHAR